VEPVDLAVIDASFISLKTILPSVLKLIREGALVVALVKPQFEVEKGTIGQGGVVRDPEQHRQVLATLEAFGRDLGVAVLGRCASPLTGPAGNREFFLWLRKPGEGQAE
jgi:23S rRNA (cytidine1920-2'-O)/16S rRNA (cytidine1409-2'-O)-methyltransferase